MAEKMILAVLSSQLLLWFVQFFISRHFHKKDATSDKLEILGHALLSLLRYRLYEEMTSDKLNKDKLPILAEIYTSYVELGGNGTVKKIYEDYILKSEKR